MSFPILAKKQNFLPENLIMVDCEMTGPRPMQDELLQVAMVKLQLNGTTYEEVGEPLVIYMKWEGQPTTPFQKTYLKDIIAKCNESNITPEKAKVLVEEWLGDLLGNVVPVGDCVIADLRFLYQNNIIVDSYYDEENKQVPGTFHYEIFDMNSIKCIARTLWGEKKKPQGEDPNHHDALVDCRNQTLELNQILAECFFSDGTVSSRYYQDMDSSYVHSNLPADIAPSVEVVDLPEHILDTDLELKYGDLMLAAKDFEQVQGLMNKIMIEEKITEEYRPSLAGIINQFRLENELTPL